MTTKGLKQLSLAVVPAALFATVIGTYTAAGPASASGLKRGRVERGRYLVNAIGCHDCHTPKKMGPHGPVPDMERALIGHPEGSELPAPPPPQGPWVATGLWDLTAWSGPWGISYAINLTPDENTGIGIWTEEMFVKALRTGRHMGASRPILPPMPWENIGQLNDEDLKSVFAYLRSLPPRKNRIPEAVVNEAPEAAAQ